jgi:hypothetical protein
VGFVRQDRNDGATATAGEQGRRIGPARILVVEDNDDLRAMLVMSLFAIRWPASAIVWPSRRRS